MVSARGRGRLSSIDELPPEADPYVQAAAAALLDRDRTQADILFELNGQLAVIGCEPISSSAFNRYSTRLAATTRRLQETRDIASAVTAKLGPERADETTIMLVELIKTAALNILEKGALDPESFMMLSKGLQHAVSAQKVSADVRRLSQAELKAKAEKATEAAADGIVAATPGADKAAVLKRIREDVYGIFEK